MTARREGSTYLVSGIKWPITNVLYGGLCVLVVKLDGHDLPPGRDSGMLLFDVPNTDTSSFRMTRNRLQAFDYLWNARFRLSNHPVPCERLLGPPGKGLAQAFSSLAKGRGGICVNSSAKILRLLAQVVLDPRQDRQDPPQTSSQGPSGGWLRFRTTFGKKIGDSLRVQAWLGRAVSHALASRALGDLCFQLGAKGVRDETLGMIAKVFATKALLQSAIHSYQIQGGRSVHVDERRSAARQGPAAPISGNFSPIENYIGENMHEFLIATVYEGPNAVLSDVGAPNAMTRAIRTRFLEPIGLAEAQGKSSFVSKARFGWFAIQAIVGSWSPWPGSLDGIAPNQPAKCRWVHRALRRNRILGRRIVFTIAHYQRSFIDQSFELGDEGGIFDQLSSSVAALAFAMSLDKISPDDALVANALDVEAELRLRGKNHTSQLQALWSNIGQRLLDSRSTLHRDLISDIEVSEIPLDPRSIDRYI